MIQYHYDNIEFFSNVACTFLEITYLGIITYGNYLIIIDIEILNFKFHAESKNILNFEF